MNKNLKISVIIPIFNTAKDLPKCIESVVHQTYKNIEVLLINDGSTDKSGEICERYSKIDKRIKIFHQRNQGASTARNIGIKNSTGNYIIFLDSDDFWANDNCLMEVINKIQSFSEEIDVVFLKCAVIKKDGKLTKSRGYEFNAFTDEELLKNIYRENKVAVSACLKLLNKKLFDDKSLYFQNGLLVEDIDWFFKLILKAKMYISYEGAFYCYQIRRGSASHSFTQKRIEDYTCILEKWITFVKESNFSMEKKKYFYNMLGYEYEILISTLYSYEKKIIKTYSLRIKKLFWLLNFRNKKRSKAIKFLKNVIGFNSTCKLLNFYLNNRKIK